MKPSTGEENAATKRLTGTACDYGNILKCSAFRACFRDSGRFLNGRRLVLWKGARCRPPLLLYNQKLHEPFV